MSESAECSWSQHPSRRGLAALPAASALLALAMLALTACGGGSGSSPASAARSSSSTPARGRGATGGGAPPGVTGTIAEVDASSFELQNPTDGQVTVDVSGSTRFSLTVATDLAAVKPDTCITASAAAANGSGATATPSPSAPLAATTVTVEPSVSGTCAGSGGGLGGGGPRLGDSGGVPSSRPSQRPSNAGSGAPGRSGGFAARVVGKVTAVQGSTITVQAFSFGPRSSASATPAATPSTTERIVTVSAATKYLMTQTATKSALIVGQCAMATGSSDSTGTVSATRVAVSPPQNGTCTFGFGRRGGGGGNGGGGNGSGGSGSGGSGSGGSGD